MVLVTIRLQNHHTKQIYVVCDRAPFSLTLLTIGDTGITKMRTDLQRLYDGQGDDIQGQIDAWILKHRGGREATADVVCDEMFDALPVYARCKDVLPDLHSDALQKRKFGQM